MTTGPLHDLVGRLRQAARVGEAGGLDDAELLRRWIANSDEAAFELLLWRHGPLVLSVCRRWLRRPQDVEDAFQATFLILVRKGGGISRRQALASWLHTVACRVAREAHLRRRDLAALPAEVAAPPPTAGGEDLAALDEEVARLPEKYRAAFILCCLQGRSTEQAARELGVPVGTVHSRLSRARDRLRDRLTRRGIDPAAAVVAPVTAELVSRALATATTSAAGPAVTLMEGALHAMFLTKVKTTATALLAVVVLGVGGGLVGGQVSTSGSDPRAKVKANGPARSTTTADNRQLQLDQARAELAAALAQVEMLRRRLELLDKAPATSPTKPAPPKTTKAPISSSVSGPAKYDLRSIKDELSILEAKLKASEAEVRASQAMLEEAKLRLNRAGELRKKGGRAVISEDEYGALRAAMLRYEAELRAKEAAQVVSTIELQRARRRAEALATTLPPPVSRTLEQRVAALEETVKALRAELDRQRGRPAPAGPTNSPR